MQLHSVISRMHNSTAENENANCECSRMQPGVHDEESLRWMHIHADPKRR